MAIILLACKDIFDLDGSSSLWVSSAGFTNGNVLMGV